MRNQNWVYVYFGARYGHPDRRTLGGHRRRSARDVAAGDINRDGWPDLVTANSAGATTSVLFNTGGTLLTPQTPVAVGGVPMRVALVGLDPTAFSTSRRSTTSGTPRIAALQGQKTGPLYFANQTAANLPASAGVRGLSVSDFTADGRRDLVTALSNTGQAVVVENRSGTPCAARRSPARRARTSPSTRRSPRRPQLQHGRPPGPRGRHGHGPIRPHPAERQRRVQRRPRDRPDRSRTAGRRHGRHGRGRRLGRRGGPGQRRPGQVQVYLGNGTGGLAAGAVRAAGVNTSALVIGDFNGDGAKDVVAASEGNGKPYRFLGNGRAGSAPERQSTSEPEPCRARWSPSTSTTTPGWTWRSPTSAPTTYRSSSETATARSSWAPSAVGTHPQAIAAADLDGNGRPDLVTADNGASQVSVIRRQRSRWLPSRAALHRRNEPDGRGSAPARRRSQARHRGDHGRDDGQPVADDPENNGAGGSRHRAITRCGSPRRRSPRSTSTATASWTWPCPAEAPTRS